MALSAYPAHAASSTLPIVQLHLATTAPNSHRITLQAELANTQQSRIQGLMGRQTLKAGQGMLFDFKATAIQCMWMKNTPIALDVGFFNENGVLVNTATMTPYSETVHCSNTPIRYALEVPAGWLKSQNIAPGALLQLPWQSSTTNKSRAITAPTNGGPNHAGDDTSILYNLP